MCNLPYHVGLLKEFGEGGKGKKGKERKRRKKKQIWLEWQPPSPKLTGH